MPFYTVRVKVWLTPTYFYESIGWKDGFLLLFR